MNKQHLKILEFQPAGKSVIPTHIFPSTKEHFALLKSLGADRAFTKLVRHHDTTNMPWITTGFEICFKNGSSILIGAKGNYLDAADLTKKVKSIHIEDFCAVFNDNNYKEYVGTLRYVQF